jgi:hypothetical protein
MQRHIGLARVVVTAMVIAVGSIAASADSHVRIVRLSSAEGQVQVDRAGQGLERAILNTPIVEGTRVVTGNDGLAEVEFENQSAVRLTENSEIKFSQLLMNDAGMKINRIRVDNGLVYIDTASKGNDSYILSAGDRSVMVPRDSLVRLTVDPTHVQVAVFKGEAQLEGQAEPVIIHKKETLTLDLQRNSNGYDVAKGVEEVRYDSWNKEREAYGKAYGENQGYGGPNSAYGLQDLNYYGDFFYANGLGYVWQPYGFAGSMLNWDPYSNGAWMFYPGFGYSWASAYPWGWLPFHYGSWAFVNGAGWAWVPGRFAGQWSTNGYQIVPRVTNAPPGWTAATPPMSTSSATSSPTLLVGKGGGLPLSIPGGRIPPNFASVVRSSAVASGGLHGSTKPNSTAANRAAFASPQTTAGNAHANPAGHVFASPASRSIFASEDMHSMYGGSRSEGVSTSNTHGSSASLGHGTSAGSSTGTAAHK